MSGERYFKSTVRRLVIIDPKQSRDFNELEKDERMEIWYNYLDWEGKHELYGINFTVHSVEGTDWKTD